MPKPLKHPDLQKKFEALLCAELRTTSHMPSADILETAKEKREQFNLRPDELEDLMVNSSNYFARAKQNGVLVSHGKRRGYSLAAGVANSNDTPLVALNDPTRPVTVAPPACEVENDVQAPERAVNLQWESFLHLPASLALAQRFGARVLSLPKASDRAVKWGNPDMLMIRPSAIESLDYFLRQRDIDISRFRAVDDSAKAILSSIELKFDLRRNRSKWFQAVAETAANSLWANEAWLVFVDAERSTEPLDRELLALARSAEIGILELALRSDDGDYIEVIEHRPATVRARLRVGDLDAEQRCGLLSGAHQLLVDYERDGSFLDAEGDVHVARVLLQQALQNLQEQTGFSRRSLADALAPLREANGDFVGRVARASIDLVQELIPRAEDTAWPELQRAIRKTVFADEAELLQHDLEALRQHGMGGSH
jgi:hypothetical protein